MWVSNQQSKGQPWICPLPPPRQSPLQTLGDALGNAKIEKKVRNNSPHASRDRRPGSACPQSSSVGPRRLPSTTVNVDCRVPGLDPQAMAPWLEINCGRAIHSSRLRLADQRQSMSPAVKETGSMIECHKATSKD
jgi:hypothetical protein